MSKGWRRCVVCNSCSVNGPLVLYKHFVYVFNHFRGKTAGEFGAGLWRVGRFSTSKYLIFIWDSCDLKGQNPNDIASSTADTPIIKKRS